VIRLKKLSVRAFSGLYDRSSFLAVNESSPFLGWHERISRCSGVPDTYLVEYVFDHKKTWLSFLVTGTGDTVCYAHPGSIPRETLDNISRGTVLKLWLQLHKKYCLHASGIQTGGSAILFLGPKGAGKSTTAAYFNANGYPVWCDDYCTLEQSRDTFYALPGETWLKVKKETITGLSITSGHTAPLYLPVPAIEARTAPVSDFKTLYRSAAPQGERQPLPLKAVFLLQERGKDAPGTVIPARKTEALKAIMDEIMLRPVVSKEYIAFYFVQTKQLLDRVQVYKARAADDLAQIHVFFESILTHVTDADN